MSFRPRLMALTSALLMGLFVFVLFWNVQAPKSAAADGLVQAGGAAFGLPRPEADWSHNAIDPDAFYGSELLLVDIDNDLDQDLIVGAPYEDVANIGNDVGAVYVYLNDVGQLSTTPSQIIYGKSDGERFGAGLAAGNFSGDDSLDLAVGAPGYVSAAINKSIGAVYILQGNGSALPTLSNPTVPVLKGNGADTDFGQELATIEALSTGDSWDELVVGEPWYAGSGATHIFISLSGGFPADPTFSLTGGPTSGSFGTALAAGDYDGDSLRRELAIGAPHFDKDLIEDVGAAFVYGITETGTSPAFVYTATLMASYYGDRENGLLGWDVALQSMDPISYTHADLLVGIPGYPKSPITQPNGDGGAIAFYRNEFIEGSTPSRAGILEDADWVALAKQPGGMFGYAVAAADFDNDGYLDLIGSAKLNDLNEAEEGAVFYYLTQGQPFPPAPDPSWMGIGNSDKGYYGAALASGDLNASSPAVPRDVLIGAPGMLGGGAVFLMQARTGLTFTVQPTLSNSGPVMIHSPVSFNVPAVGGTDNVYLWEFGDGQAILTDNLDGAAEIVSHTYQSAGLFSASVRVMNLSAMSQVSSVVEVIQPLSGLTISTTSPTRYGNPTQLGIKLAGGGPMTITIDFGDGSAPAVYPYASNPLLASHTYTQVGVFKLQVTAANLANTVSKTAEIGIFKPTQIVPGVGGKAIYSYTNGIKAGAQFAVDVPGPAVGENVELRFTPREDAGEYADDGSGLLYFDLKVVPEQYAADGAAAESSCLYLPFVAGDDASGTMGSWSNAYHGCGGVPEYEFLEPVTLTFNYPQAMIPSGVDENSLVFEFFDLTLQQWVDGALTCDTPSTYVRDTVNNVIELAICHQSRWSWRPK